MLIPNHHPDAEVLSAIAAGDSDVADAAAVTEHLDACTRCATLVSELGILRATLAELPDLAPSRPLRLLPDVAAPAADGPARWARRLFGPILAGGAALAMVGMIGTAAPALTGMASQEGAAPAGDAATDRLAAASNDAEMGGVQSSARDDYGGVRNVDSGEGATDGGPPQAAVGPADNDVETLTTSVERSPWPMVLFTGVALMVGAALLRWILAPRAP